MKKALPKAKVLIANSLLILFFSAGLLEAAQTYSNPVIPEIGPADPTAIFYEGRFYLYPTGDNRSYHVYTSDDLVNWTKGRRIFIPGGRNVWAPDVFYNRSDGKFYLYYTANWRIGFAVSDKPDQTFRDKGIFIDGAIDAHMFQDSDNRYYLYFVKRGFEIHVQKMTDPLHLAGKSKLVIKPAKPWEARVTEGPWMIKHNNIYYLLYSGYGANTKHYAVGYATANNPMGPFTKYAANPIIKGGERIYGPGHGSVTKDSDGNLWHVYHQKKGPAVGWDRFICIDPLFFDPNGVLHGKATRAKPQSAPIIKAAPKTR